MPIYGYECTQCGHQLEVLQSVSDDPLRSCPECMGPLRKLLYPVGVIFKGSGFYSTDYKAGSNGSKRSDSSGSGESKSETQSESKSEPKSDSSGGKDSKPAKPN
jgi:putative FmdB family regulatory protein